MVLDRALRLLLQKLERSKFAETALRARRASISDRDRGTFPPKCVDPSDIMAAAGAHSAGRGAVPRTRLSRVSPRNAMPMAAETVRESGGAHNAYAARWDGTLFCARLQANSTVLGPDRDDEREIQIMSNILGADARRRRCLLLLGPKSLTGASWYASDGASAHTVRTRFRGYTVTWMCAREAPTWPTVSGVSRTSSNARPGPARAHTDIKNASVRVLPA